MRLHLQVAVLHPADHRHLLAALRAALHLPAGQIQAVPARVPVVAGHHPALVLLPPADLRLAAHHHLRVNQVRAAAARQVLARLHLQAPLRVVHHHRRLLRAQSFRHRHLARHRRAGALPVHRHRVHVGRAVVRAGRRHRAAGLRAVLHRHPGRLPHRHVNLRLAPAVHVHQAHQAGPAAAVRRHLLVDRLQARAGHRHQVPGLPAVRPGHHPAGQVLRVRARAVPVVVVRHRHRRVRALYHKGGVNEFIRI